MPASDAQREAAMEAQERYGTVIKLAELNATADNIEAGMAELLSLFRDRVVPALETLAYGANAAPRAAARPTFVAPTPVAPTPSPITRSGEPAITRGDLMEMFTAFAERINPEVGAEMRAEMGARANGHEFAGG